MFISLPTLHQFQSKTDVSLTFPSLINLRNESMYSFSFVDYAGAQCLPINL